MEFNVKVKLKTSSIKKTYFDSISYFNSTHSDKMTITNNEIEVSGRRNKNTPIDSILVNTSSTIYKQILKGLVFLYCISEELVELESIKIQTNISGIEDNHIEKNLIQPFKLTLDSKLIFNESNLLVLFDNNAAAEVLLRALILYIKAYNLNDFDYYWKSFNCLYSQISSEEKEFDKLVDMRIFIDSNHTSLRQSIDFFDTYDKSEIRKLRLRDYILSSFPELNDTQKYRDMVLRFSDERLILNFEEMMPYRIDNLMAKSLYNDVINHISSKKASCIKDNKELLCFYILKYCYFLRNKYFHAEKDTPIFILKENNEIKELNQINSLLSIFLGELLKANSIYI